MSGSLYELSTGARLDLLQVWNYLAENVSFDVADKVLADIKTAISKIIKSPGHGHRRPDLTDRDVRFYRVYSFLIVYRMDKKPLHILRVLHASRDIKSQLSE